MDLSSEANYIPIQVAGCRCPDHHPYSSLTRGTGGWGVCVAPKAIASIQTLSTPTSRFRMAWGKVQASATIGSRWGPEVLTSNR